MVVWEGSHIIMAEAFQKVFEGHDAQEWSEIDVTEVYQAMRKRVFKTCRRVTVHALPGEAYVLHRLALHGVAPWVKGAVAPEQRAHDRLFAPGISGLVSMALFDVMFLKGKLAMLELRPNCELCDVDLPCAKS